MYLREILNFFDSRNHIVSFYCQYATTSLLLTLNMRYFVKLFELLPIFYVPLTMRALTGGPLSALGSGTSFCIVTHAYIMKEQMNSFSDSDSDIDRCT